MESFLKTQHICKAIALAAVGGAAPKAELQEPDFYFILLILEFIRSQIGTRNQNDNMFKINTLQQN